MLPVICYFLVTVELLNELQGTTMNDEFNCTSMTIPHFQLESFLGHQETVQGGLSFCAQRFSDGDTWKLQGNCTGTKTTVGVIVHFTIKSHEFLSPHPARIW